IGVDNDFPVIRASASPLANNSGWNNTNVLVTFSCTDATSGVASCPAPVNATLEGAGQVITGQAVDKAGNIIPSPQITVAIDKTPPVVTISSPALGAVVSTSTITVSGNASDLLSGVTSVSCNGVAAALTGSSFSCSQSLVAGTNKIQVQAIDTAGNSSSAIT